MSGRGAKNAYSKYMNDFFSYMYLLRLFELLLVENTRTPRQQATFASFLHHVGGFQPHIKPSETIGGKNLKWSKTT